VSLLVAAGDVLGVPVISKFQLWLHGFFAVARVLVVVMYHRLFEFLIISLVFVKNNKNKGDESNMQC
jgi:hypothetical protein